MPAGSSGLCHTARMLSIARPDCLLMGTDRSFTPQPQPSHLWTAGGPLTPPYGPPRHTVLRPSTLTWLPKARDRPKGAALFSFKFNAHTLASNSSICPHLSSINIYLCAQEVHLSKSKTAGKTSMPITKEPVQNFWGNPLWNTMQQLKRIIQLCKCTVLA